MHDPRESGASPAALLPVPVLPVRRTAPAGVEVELEVVAVTVRVADADARLLSYNNAVPGPLLRLREGDHVRLALTNRLNEPTNLHLHGLHVPPSVDDAFRVIAPGETTIYEFDLPAGSAGTYWYHSHVHGRVARQLSAGLAGALVVEGPLDDMPELREAEEHVLVLKDLALVDGGPAPYEPADWMNGKEGDLVLVNGVREPVLAAGRGTLRLRLVNASTARYYHLALDGGQRFETLHLIGTGTGFVERPVAVDRFVLAPGERAEVLVQLAPGRRVRLVDLPYDRGKHDMHAGHDQHERHGGHAPMNGHAGHARHQTRAAHEAHEQRDMHAAHGNAGGPAPAPTAVAGAEPAGHDHPATLLTIVPLAHAEPLPLPGCLTPVEVLDEAQAAATRRIVMSETMDPLAFFINGRPFDHDRVDVHSAIGTLEVWDVENASDMDHPFHLHVYPFQVLARNGVPEPVRAWRDTVNVRPHETVRLAVPFRDFTGRTVFHCHIAEHEDLGMMGVLAVHATPGRGDGEQGGGWGAAP
jgi:FtsP/CotA-like multicopper oxidase with cupredoxin domain